VRKSNLEEGIDELARSIADIGVQQPVVVFEKKDKRYELIIGQRRFLACRKLRETKIPALITEVKGATDALVKSFSENIHRLDLDYRDKMKVAIRLLSEYGSIEKVAKTLGVSDQTVKKYLGYAAVPEAIKELVDKGRLGAATAIEIVQNITDEEKAIEIAKLVNEFPRSEDRGYIIDVARENPRRTVQEIARIAKKRSLMKKITIHVTERVYMAISEAAQKYEVDMEFVARGAIEEWLHTKGLLK
ncbi:ParB/RepB/Spo0J family partition protein, partial [Candidatus Bathyarchaeota archaeon]|nr:ParB/RepB/Spo0J family partition protein [Candidatus Bathyarchaeota archaeon]